MASIKSNAGLIGVRSALIGSLLFTILEGVAYRILEPDSPTEILRTKFSMLILVFCIGSVLSAIPGYLGGRLLKKLSQRSKWTRRLLMTIGATLGIVAVVIISIPYLWIVLAAHNWWSIYNNPAFTIYIIRLVEAIIIAGLMGSWSGSLISKLSPAPTGS